MSTKRKRTSISTCVRVDLSDIFEEIETEDLIEELQARDVPCGPSLGCDESDAHRALEYLLRGDAQEARLILERALYPKFGNVADAMQKLAAVTGAPQ